MFTVNHQTKRISLGKSRSISGLADWASPNANIYKSCWRFNQMH